MTPGISLMIRPMTTAPLTAWPGHLVHQLLLPLRSHSVRRPPEVWASLRTTLASSGSDGSHRTWGINDFRLRWVPPGAIPRWRKLPGARQQGHLGEAHLRSNAAPESHAVEMAQQPKAGDIGAGVDARVQHRRTGAPVQHLHGLKRALQHLFIDLILLASGGDDPGAYVLGQDQQIALLGPRVGHLIPRPQQAGHRQSVLGLLVVDGVPANDQEPRLGGLVVASLEDLDQELLGKVYGVCDDVQPQQWRAPHSIDITEGVGRGDGPETVRVVNDGWEEVHRLHQGKVGPAGDTRRRHRPSRSRPAGSGRSPWVAG